MLVFPFLTLEHHTTFKESMINRLSNLINHNPSAARISQVLCYKGRHNKRLFFFNFGHKGGKGLGQSKKSLLENTQMFSPILTIFFTNVLPIFVIKGGRCVAQSKISLSEKTEVVKKGGGGGLSFVY